MSGKKILVLRETRNKEISPKELLLGVEQIEICESNCCGESTDAKVVLREEWHDLREKDVQFLTNVESSSQDLVLTLVENRETKQNYHTAALMEQIVRVLKPGGRLCLRETVTTVETTNGYVRPAKEIFNLLTLTGFVNSTLKPINQEQYYVEVTAFKPKYEIGASAAISFKRKTPTPAVTPKQPVWKLDDNDETIDEDTLIEEADLNIKKNKAG